MLSPYIFIDTFALATLTKDHYEALSLYLHENNLQLIISPMLLVEYFNPVMQQGDRTENAVRLLMKHDFVIVNQDTIMDMEEAAYPNALTRLPVALDNLKLHNDEDRYQLLYQLFHYGIPGNGYDLKTWAERHHVNKMSWKADVDTY